MFTRLREILYIEFDKYLDIDKTKMLCLMELWINRQIASMGLNGMNPTRVKLNMLPFVTINPIKLLRFYSLYVLKGPYNLKIFLLDREKLIFIWYWKLVRCHTGYIPLVINSRIVGTTSRMIWWIQKKTTFFVLKHWWFWQNWVGINFKGTKCRDLMKNTKRNILKRYI